MEEGGEDLDPWTSPDKFQHILFCFTLTLIFSLLAAKTPHPFLRRRPIAVASFLSLSAGAAKEFADHFGFFHSSGASFKDAIADIAGVVLACSLLSLSRFLKPKPKSKPEPEPDEVVSGIALV